MWDLAAKCAGNVFVRFDVLFGVFLEVGFAFNCPYSSISG